MKTELPRRPPKRSKVTREPQVDCLQVVRELLAENAALRLELERLTAKEGK